MNFLEFSKLFANQVVLDIRNAENYFGRIDRRRLFEWQKKGYITKVVSNHYILGQKSLDDNDLKIIANQIYQPSYVSLQSALAFYRFIPEAVFQITCITTRRNQNFDTQAGAFHYRKVKLNIFWGYSVFKQSNGSFFMADPQKALLDYLYFLPYADQKNVLAEVRFNQEELLAVLDMEKLKTYLQLFQSRKLVKALFLLKEMGYVKP